MTSPLRPFISSRDRDQARRAAKAQQATYRMTSLPLLAISVSIASVVIAVGSAFYANTAQRAELLRLLDSEIREAIPVIAQARFSRNEPIDLEPFADINHRLEAPMAGLFIWQSDIEAMRSKVAWERSFEETSLQYDKDAAQLRRTIEIKAAEEAKAAKKTRTAVR
jgi:hypothetical protein